MNSGHTCSMISLGGSPLALLGLLLAGIASSGILPLIVCDCVNIIVIYSDSVPRSYSIMEYCIVGIYCDEKHT